MRLRNRGNSIPLPSQQAGTNAALERLIQLFVARTTRNIVQSRLVNSDSPQINRQDDDLLYGSVVLLAFVSVESCRV